MIGSDTSRTERGKLSTGERRRGHSMSYDPGPGESVREDDREDRGVLDLNDEDMHFPHSRVLLFMYAPGPGLKRTVAENRGVSDNAHEFDLDELVLEDVCKVLAVKVLLEHRRVVLRGITKDSNCFRTPFPSFTYFPFLWFFDGGIGCLLTSFKAFIS